MQILEVPSPCALSGSAHRTVSLQVKQVVQKAVEDGCRSGQSGGHSSCATDNTTVL